MSLAKNIEFLSHLPRLNGFNGLAAVYGRSLAPAVNSPLVETTDFDTNPGALKMYSFVPEGLPRGAALVVVLHGCGQSAAGYDLGAGWSTLARHYGFALLLPEQQPANNANTCFNWFNPEDITRGKGEAASIRQMIARMVVDHKLDPRRIYITGLSAGGAMTSVMLATYPDVFAAGAIVAGLPFGIATNLREALNGMMQAPSRPANELGDLVRGAWTHDGPWPKVSVWHGSADRTVNPGNADAIVSQWLDVHGLPETPMAKTMIDGYPREVWWDANGETVVESYTITGMAHGTPLGVAANDERYGEAGAFLLEAGISSSYHIANFFGLTERARRSAPAPREVAKPAIKPTVKPVTKPVAKEATKQPTPLPRATPPRQAMPSQSLRRRAREISDVITRALTAAGLMK
ncbi:PHB depolymerase family esterase [Bradyrhizobium sp. Ai1a-2]|uniref:extracellular catalytic domain type 1 short-chain-length polyhydroxyalkanoate depolymerase n=1 Tax=Bradyrhizobium sp. Ai1a-2 TaxID=196490 RepID=UPI000482B01A|nr:PHB depolymerase family esterase [Bradyrhizobium sp. Ai1a-2]